MSADPFLNRPIGRRSVLRGGLGALAASAFAGPLLTACGGDSSGGGDGKEMSFWNFYGPADDNGPQSKWFVSLAEQWNANNDVKVELRYIPGKEYLGGNVLQTAFQAGQGPDIFLISPGDFLRYYNGGVLQDLSAQLSDQTKADYLPGMLEARSVDGKIYGLPMEIEPLAMYYSEAAFEKAGLSEADLPKTWDQTLAVAQKLTGKNKYGVMFETAPGYYQNFTWYPFLWQGDGAVIKDGKVAFDTPAAVQALKFWQDTIQSKVAPRKALGGGGGDVLANLGAGAAAMQQSGIWAVSDMRAKGQKTKYGIIPHPTPEGGKQATDLGGWAFVANAKGKNPEAAAKFIAWALGSTDAEGVERGRQWNTVVKTNVPPRKSVQQAADSQGAFAEGVLKKFVSEIAPTGQPEPRFPPEVYQPIADAIQACQLNATDPGKAAADAAEKIDTFLKTYQGAPIS
ncbi:multiple sugar transport system substrate-binding protein [Kribbella sp. VKM Ac-2527]|uniref:Multiple sugar transport system substrate-binding protein n=1 Tax=Kribbella caucasensis TaxID=2512215 RepID=A0A4R6KA45_9ACTN|nr:sugar ABC transporter substrate-binding protein [Kribbella sp. VKM Ac-2527]TDO44952.1 multiple sugar transport system substrate-binding protein [Kribbella sp. VKM Ac-2527]